MSNFVRSKNNLELKLLLLNTLEDFNAELADVLNKSISALTDRDIVELIIDLRNEENDDKIISSVLKKLINKEKELIAKIEFVLGKEFLEQYLNK